MKVRNERDLAAGLLFLVFGGGAAGISATYSIGTASQAGPGFFPLCVGLLLAGLGLVQAVRALAPEQVEERIERFDVRTVLIVIASVVAFGVLLQPAGLVVASAAVVLISALASEEFTLLRAVATAVVISGFTVGLFVYGLHLAVPVWPAAFAG